MVRHDDAVHAKVHRRVGVLDRLDALEHDGSVPVLAQERDVRPRAERARVGLAQPPRAKLKRRTRLLVTLRKTRAQRIQVERERRALVRAGHEAATDISVAPALHEDRVGRADLHADARYERQVGGVEVVWAPAEREGVYSDDESGEARRFGATEDGERHLVGSWPAVLALKDGVLWGGGRRRTNIVDTSGARRRWPWPRLRWNACSRST